MNINTLFCLLRLKSLKPAEAAKRAGLSRQVLSLWKQKAKGQKSSNINVYSKTQEQLAYVLRVRTEDLNQPIDVIESPESRKAIETELLWDKLYQDIESFSVAVVKGRPDALARLVQVYGLYSSAKIVGKQIWEEFPNYKNKIHPAYRKQAEIVWTLAQSQI